MSEPNTTPPVPPVESAPPAPPVPRYGEYAPGFVPPPAGSEPAPAPTAAPVYGAYGSGQQQYGTYGAPIAGQSAGRTRKTWDVVLTVALLVMGLFGSGLGIVYGLLFTDPALLAEALEAQGYPGFSGGAGAAPAVLIISHVVLYLIALSSILLLIARRIAFWLPLAAGVVAAIIFWTTLTGVMLSDPAFLDQLS